MYQQGNSKKHGRASSKGAFVDDEMFNLGFDRKLVVRDKRCKSIAQAELYAARKLAEGRRASWHLNYTLAGHTSASLVGGGRAVWSPDTMVRVDDELLGIKDTFWIAEVTYARHPQTTTTIELMRKEDLFFGGEDEG